MWEMPCNSYCVILTLSLYGNAVLLKPEKPHSSYNGTSASVKHKTKYLLPPVAEFCHSPPFLAIDRKTAHHLMDTGFPVLAMVVNGCQVALHFYVILLIFKEI